MTKKTQLALAFMLGLAVSLSIAALMKISGQAKQIIYEKPVVVLAAPVRGSEEQVAPSISYPGSGPYSSGGLFSIDWETLDGGGGTANGGSFLLSYTLGQPDAGEHTGGNYRLQGGFWPGWIDSGRNYLPLLHR